MAKRKKMNGIAKIIAYLTAAAEDDNLCATGRARLKWWKTNGKRFKSVKAALFSWTPDKVQAWFDYARIDGASMNPDDEFCWNDLDEVINGWNSDMAFTKKQLKALKAVYKERPDSEAVEFMIGSLKENELLGNALYNYEKRGY